MTTRIQIQQHDAFAIELDPDLCPDCEVRVVSHAVCLDLRGAGRQEDLGHYCGECAERLVAAIREGLPGDTEDGTTPENPQPREWTREECRWYTGKGEEYETMPPEEVRRRRIEAAQQLAKLRERGLA